VGHHLTTAIPEGETAPDVFFLDMRNVAWDGTVGVALTAAWDGHGMAATQSHALRFVDFPASSNYTVSSTRQPSLISQGAPRQTGGGN
jgi:hypothetical protein